mgnify:CR=1 FL=1
MKEWYQMREDEVLETIGSDANGRVPGAVKMAGVWLIPKTAEKPIDGRTKLGKEQKHE